MKLLKPADIEQWLQSFRSKSTDMNEVCNLDLSSESVQQLQKQMQS